MNLQCIKQPENEFSLCKNLRVIITNSKLIKGGMFSSSYVNYTIVSKPLEYTVERRFSDFYWLRNILSREYPGVYLPPMAPKTTGRSFEKEFLDQRHDMLQKFLTLVSEHDELRASIYFSAFLKFSDGDHWTMMRDEMEKAFSTTSGLKDNYTKKLFEGSKPVRVADFKTLSGTAHCRISKQLRDFAVNSEELQRNAYPMYSKLEDLTEELKRDIEKLVETIARLCDQFKQLSDVHKKFNDTTNEGKWDLPQKLYDVMNQSLARWGVSIRKNTNVITEHMTKTFRFSKMEYDSMTELIRVRNIAGQEYYKSLQNLDAQKERILLIPDPLRWEINYAQVKLTPEDVAKDKVLARSLMMPKETQVIQEMKNVFGYLNCLMVQELSLLANSRTKRYITAMNNFCSEQVEILEGQSTVFTNLKNNLFAIYELLPEVKQLETVQPSPQNSTSSAGGDGRANKQGSLKTDSNGGFKLV